VTALLPVGQGVGVYAALKRAADTTFDDRTRGQVMADTLVERVTGRPAEVPTPIAVQLVISDRTAFAGDNAPATITGYGPIPAAVARQMTAAAVTDPRSAATLRRLYRAPPTGRWSRWNRGRGGSRKGWPLSLPSATRPAGPPTATPRSATSTTPALTATVDPPPRSTGKACVNAATTTKRPAHRRIRGSRRDAIPIDRATAARRTRHHGRRDRRPRQG
jgi:hypothetical protein